MMKMHLLSGLNLPPEGFEPPRTDADVVVLAGDIAPGPNGLRWARRWFSGPIVYVPGNQEFHHFGLDSLDELKREAAAAGIHLLDRDVAVIDGVRFLGCTLWTDFDLFGAERRAATMRVAQAWVDDFQFITDAGATFTPARARALHLRDRDWLRQRLADERPDQTTVVVTHHAPYAAPLAPCFRNDGIGAAFVSDLGDLLGHCHTWMHGSGDGRLEHVVRGTRIVCNAAGCDAERGLLTGDAPFEPGLTIAVPGVHRPMNHPSQLTPSAQRTDPALYG
jgi:hypothetical protein